MAYNEYWWIMLLSKESDGSWKPRIWRLPGNVHSQIEADRMGREKLRNNPFVAYMTHNADQSEAVATGRSKLIAAGYDLEGSLRRSQRNFDPDNL